MNIVVYVVLIFKFSAAGISLVPLREVGHNVKSAFFLLLISLLFNILNGLEVAN
jgi:hypothetical protein